MQKYFAYTKLFVYLNTNKFVDDSMEVQPTESELEILQVLWQKGASTVREVNEELSRNRNAEIGYTTTLKLMQIMHDKNMVERDTSNRTHVYKALHNQNKTQKTILKKMINTVFNGSASQLIMQALSSNQTSKEELDMIRDVLKELDKTSAHGK